MRHLFSKRNITSILLLLAVTTGCASRPTSQTTPDCQVCDGAAKVSAVDTSGPAHANGYMAALPGVSAAEIVANAPGVKSAEAQVASAQTGVTAAKAMNQWQLSLDTSTGYSETSNVSRSTSRDGEAYSYALTARLPLYQGGRNTAALDVAQSQLLVSTEAAKDQRISTALSLLSAKAAVRRQTDSITALDQYSSRLRKLRDDVVDEKQLGSATGVDIGEVDRQILRLQVERKQAVLALTGAQETLLQLNAQPVGKADLDPQKVAQALPRHLASLLDIAMKNNPRIAARTAQMSVADARIAQARANYNPAVDLSVSAGGGRTSGSQDDELQTSAFVRLSVPIYSGDKDALIQGRHEDLRAAMYDRDNAVLGVRAAVITAFDRHRQASEMLTLARKQLAVARGQIAGVRQERKLGERSVFDEIRAISDTSDAELDVATASYEVAVSEYILAAETGVLAQLIGLAPQEISMAEDTVAKGGLMK